MGNKAKDRRFKKFEEQEIEIGIHEMHPKFSFEFCFDSKRGLDNTTKQTMQFVMEKVAYLSKVTWKEIQQLPKAQGFEKIPKSSFKSLPGLPNKFCNEVKIDVFRLRNKAGRLIGYIEDEIFFVVWIDTKFDMYDH